MQAVIDEVNQGRPSGVDPIIVMPAAHKDGSRMGIKFGKYGGYEGKGNIYIDGQQCPDFSWSPPRKQVARPTLQIL